MSAFDIVPPSPPEKRDHRLAAAQSVLREREAELLELKGPCNAPACSLHRAHRGPCNIAQK